MSIPIPVRKFLGGGFVLLYALILIGYSNGHTAEMAPAASQPQDSMRTNPEVLAELGKFARSGNFAELKESWKAAVRLPEDVNLPDWPRNRGVKLASVLEVIKAAVDYREKLPAPGQTPALNVGAPDNIGFDAGADPASIKDDAARDAYEKSIAANRIAAQREAKVAECANFKSETISYLRSYYHRHFEKQSEDEFRSLVTRVLGKQFFSENFGS